jgi:hypothetical protein
VVTARSHFALSRGVSRSLESVMPMQPADDVGLGPAGAKRRSPLAVRPDSPGRPAAPPVLLGLARIPGTLSMAGIT